MHCHGLFREFQLSNEVLVDLLRVSMNEHFNRIGHGIGVSGASTDQQIDSVEFDLYVLHQ